MESNNQQQPTTFRELLKKAYSPQNYIFLAINVFAIIILFFVLNAQTGGSIWMRLLALAFGILMGGFLGAIWSVKRNGDRATWFKNGAGTLLVFITFILWSNNNYRPRSGGYGSSASYPKTCAACGRNITSSTYDDNGYHYTCRPDASGRSAMDRAKHY